MKRFLLATTLGLSLALTARAEVLRTVDAPRILLMDVTGLTAEEGGSIELGPSPPPGGSRLVERREVVEKLREAGAEATKFEMPAAVRVVRTARRMSQAELATAAEPALVAALPPGVSLVSLGFARAVLAPPHVIAKLGALPKLPHRVGSFRTTVMFDLMDGADVALRVPGTVVLDISERGAMPDVARGGRLDVVIEKGPARVAAVGYALADADVGDVVSVRVDGTQKILEAVVVSSQLAKVVRK